MKRDELPLVLLPGPNVPAMLVPIGDGLVNPAEIIGLRNLGKMSTDIGPQTEILLRSGASMFTTARIDDLVRVIGEGTQLASAEAHKVMRRLTVPFAGLTPKAHDFDGP